MPYDYYEYFIKQRDNELFTEATELVRQNLWCDTINFRISRRWMNTEDKLLIKLYKNLRYR